MQLLCCLHPCNVPVESQLEAQRPDGITVHLDFGVPSARWAVELDIHPEHRTVDGHHRDAGRIRSLHRFGWQIEPVAEQSHDGTVLLFHPRRTLTTCLTYAHNDLGASRVVSSDYVATSRPGEEAVGAAEGEHRRTAWRARRLGLIVPRLNQVPGQVGKGQFMLGWRELEDQVRTFEYELVWLRVADTCDGWQHPEVGGLSRHYVASSTVHR